MVVVARPVAVPNPVVVEGTVARVGSRMVAFLVVAAGSVGVCVGVCVGKICFLTVLVAVVTDVADVTLEWLGGIWLLGPSPMSSLLYSRPVLLVTLTV